MPHVAIDAPGQHRNRFRIQLGCPKQSRYRIQIGVLVGTAVIVFVALGLREGTTEETVRQFLDPALWIFFVSGAIAICAMILPGISGSFLLVILSMYGPVLDAVNDRDLVTLGVFVAGTITGTSAM